MSRTTNLRSRSCEIFRMCAALVRHTEKATTTKRLWPSSVWALPPVYKEFSGPFSRKLLISFTLCKPVSLLEANTHQHNAINVLRSCL